ncbi:hypothetical protein ACWWD9_08175 [Methylovorus sp. SPW-M1]
MDIQEDQLTEAGLLEITSNWITELAAEKYDVVFNALGFAMAYQTPELTGAERIKAEIKNYRSDQYYPGVTNFSVSLWENASGGNPNPCKLVRFYKPNDMKIIATIELDLPLNDKWSDLLASFVVFEIGNNRYTLILEDITNL